MVETPTLLDRFEQRDRRALARILTLVECGESPAPPDRAVQPTRVVGVTGSAGAGKSTLIGALVEHLRSLNLRVAVVACDPQSPRTGGALLGDRVRVRFDPDDEGVFFRSLSTRGALGGIAAQTGEAVRWLKAFGFDVVLVETVGVGQDQVAVSEIVDTLVLLVTPGTGDEIQWEKAGLIELADLVVVNKSDMPGAERVREQLLNALSLSPAAATIPVLNVTAATGEGVPELWRAWPRGRSATMVEPAAPLPAA